MRRIMISVLMSAFILSAIPLSASARGPSNMAAGNVKRVRIGEPDMEWTLQFNAHEAEDNQPAKGLAIDRFFVQSPLREVQGKIG